MNPPSEKSSPDSQLALLDLIVVCERIAASLEKLERLYAEEVQLRKIQRQQAEEENKKILERQKKWDDEEPARRAQQKQSNETVRELNEQSKRLFDSIKPERWQVQLLWFMIAVILLGLLKASVVYLFGYWPTSYQ